MVLVSFFEQYESQIRKRIYWDSVLEASVVREISVNQLWVSLPFFIIYPG